VFSDHGKSGVLAGELKRQSRACQGIAEIDLGVVRVIGENDVENRIPEIDGIPSQILRMISPPQNN
jgi:hypothetical protein